MRSVASIGHSSVWKHPSRCPRFFMFAVRKVIAEIFSTITTITRKYHRASERGKLKRTSRPTGRLLSPPFRFSVHLLRHPRFLLAKRKLPKSSLPSRDVMVGTQLFPIEIVISGAQHMPGAPKIPPEDISE